MGPQDLVYERIRTETGRVGARAYVLAKELAELHPSLRVQLMAWWESGAIDMDREVEGWSIRSLIDRKQANYVSEAITWLSHLLKDPKAAQELLDRPMCEFRGSIGEPKPRVH